MKLISTDFITCTVTRLKIFALLLLLNLSSGFLLAVETEISQPTTREKAIEMFHNERFAEALPLFTKLVYDYPFDYLLKYFLGGCLVETEKFNQEAEKNLLLASSKEVPAKVFYYLGRYYHAVNNWNSAQRNYNRFKNNTSPNEAKALKVDELSALCYDHINPFVAGDKPVAVNDKTTSEPLQIVTEEPARVVKTVKVEKALPPAAEVAKAAEPMKNAKEEKLPLPAEKDATVAVVKPEPIKQSEATLAGESKNIMVAAEKTVNEVATENSILSPKVNIDSVNYVTETAPMPKVKAVAITEFIEFEINSQVTYLSADLFQVPEAKKAFLSGKQNELKLDSLLLESDKLRSEYKILENPAEKEILGAKILSIEQETRLLNSDISQQYYQARSLEQAWWTGTDFTVFKHYQQATDSIKKLQIAAKTLVVPEPEIVLVDALIQNSIQVNEGTQTKDSPANTADEKGVIYKIQIGAFPKSVPAAKKPQFDRIAKIRTIETYVNESGMTVYTTGNMKKYDDAVKLQNQVRQEGIKDAFVIALKDGKRISLPEISKK